MEAMRVRGRTSIRTAEKGGASRQERAEAYAKAEKAVQQEQREQSKIAVNLQAFIAGTSANTQQFIEMERLAIRSQQYERIRQQIEQAAAKKRSRERKVCLISIMLALAGLAMAALFIVSQ